MMEVYGTVYRVYPRKTWWDGVKEHIERVHMVRNKWVRKIKRQLTSPCLPGKSQLKRCTFIFQLGSKIRK